jgi:extradiol dioxygenase family protein
MDFFGHQVVCHLAPDDVDPEPRVYPRHFGITLRTRSDFDTLLSSARNRGVPFFAEPFVRFEGCREEHWTFFVVDPSNNLIEFKWYVDPDMRY